MWRTTLYDTTKITVELREILESGVNLWDFQIPKEGFNTPGVTHLVDVNNKIGFHEEFKKRFEDHFYFRQIGQETVGRFKHYLRTRVLEVMPYYNDLYNSFLIMKGIEDPFGNVNITETFTEESTGSSQGTATGSESATNNSKVNDSNTNDVNGSSNGSEYGTEFSSDTPQGVITNLENYMTNAKKNTSGHDDINEQHSESTSESNSEGSSSSEMTSDSSASTENKIERTIQRKGNHGVNTYAHDMIEYRDVLVKLFDRMFEEFNPLFLGVY